MVRMDHWVFYYVMYMNWVCMFPNKQRIQNRFSCSYCVLYSVRTFKRLITINLTCTYIVFNIISFSHTKIFLALVLINHLNFVSTPSLPSFFSSPLFRTHTLLFFSFSYFLWKICVSTGLVLVYLGPLFYDKSFLISCCVSFLYHHFPFPSVLFDFDLGW